MLLYSYTLFALFIASFIAYGAIAQPKPPSPSIVEIAPKSLTTFHLGSTFSPFFELFFLHGSC